nr:hypothetical protein [Tanacetum cinerariifolium]
MVAGRAAVTRKG